MALTVALFLPRAVNAVQSIQPVIAQPQFTSQGCVAELKTDKLAYEPGETPSLQITAKNPTSQPVETRLWIKVLASKPASPMARMMPVPQAIWSHEWAVQLEPGESKVATLPTDAKLPAGQNIVIAMSDRKDEVLAGKLQVVTTERLSPAVAQQAEVKP